MSMFHRWVLCQNELVEDEIYANQNMVEQAPLNKRVTINFTCSRKEVGVSN